jgi:RNA polymerase sigma-70 factor, ECF subfamily
MQGGCDFSASGCAFGVSSVWKAAKVVGGMNQSVRAGGWQRQAGLGMAGEAEGLSRALADCAAGRQAGVAAILASEGRQLLGVARRILGRDDLAEEALQDAMVLIWRRAGQFRREAGSARGWIYAVLRNRCLNILRDGRRLTTMDPADLAAVQEARQGIVPVEGWEILAGQSKLRDCLGGLDGQSRQAILLAHVAGFSHGEIAARQDMPLGTIKSLIRRGLAALKECLS